MIQLHPCDLIFTRGPHRVSRLIRWRTRAEVNHVAGVVEAGDLHSALIVEALHPRVYHGTLSRYAGLPDELEIWRPLTLTAYQREVIVTRALEMVGRRYGYSKLVLHALGAQRFAFVDRWPTCNWIWNECFWEAGLHFGHRRRLPTPGEMRHFCSSRPDLYALVRELAPIPEPEADTMESWPTPSSAPASATHRR